MLGYLKGEEENACEVLGCQKPEKTDVSMVRRLRYRGNGQGGETAVCVARRLGCWGVLAKAGRQPWLLPGG